jgi:ABC transport system ATP-binding/permease protein
MDSTFGKTRISIGSDPSCDLRLSGPGVAAVHAYITHRGGGDLVFADAGTGASRAGDQPLAAQSERSFDFRTPFTLGQGTPVPLAHPAIARMLIARGQLAPEAARLTIGRDPARNAVVVQHTNVSGQHASVILAPLGIIDNGSSTGTWVGQRRIDPGSVHALAPGGVVALGPVPIASELFEQLFSWLGLAPPRAPAPSVRTSGTALAPAVPDMRAAPRHKTVLGQVAVAAPGKDETKTIGRTPDNDITVEHPQVSSKHALLHQVAGQFFIEDRGSANGTFVQGKRIAAGERVPVQPGEKVLIGPMPLSLQLAGAGVAMVVDDAANWAGRPLYEVEAWSLVVEVPDRNRAGQTKTLIDHVSFKALPGDFIALMGPSGAGKTTLLMVLNGYLPPSLGQVRVNGENLYEVYDALRGAIGYVPQDDIVHPELTVWEAVRYSARFRLPPDYSSEEIDRRVKTTLEQLDLEAVQHLQIGKPENKVLSGGQRKRVNIAMELVTDPVIMFLDEPTSGLAADDTTALVTLLANLARQTGKTIITTIHQPARDEFEKFNLALIMGQGGVPIYYGPTHPDAYRFFGSWLERQGKPSAIDNPRDMFDMIKQREHATLEGLRAQNPNATRADARVAAARAWHQEFFEREHPTCLAMYSGRRQVGGSKGGAALPKRRPRTRGQFWLLFSRYFNVKRRDVGGMAIMLLQAPIIGLLLAAVFGGQKESIPHWCLGAMKELASRLGAPGRSVSDLLESMAVTSDHTAAIFLTAIAACWFGTSNAAREIVSERAIYLRERMVNLGIVNYVVSKFILLSLITVVQCAVLFAIVFVFLGFNGGMPAFRVGLVTLIAAAMSSVSIGLLLSALVASSEAAMALTPIALIPQVVLGGYLVPMTTNAWLQWPMYLMPARWGFQGVIAQERLALTKDPAWVVDFNKPALESAADFVSRGRFGCAKAQIASDTLYGAWGFESYEASWLPPLMLGLLTASVLTGIVRLLRRRDRI